MTRPMRIRNWKKFQHYLNRAPPWIKLHRRLLDDRDYLRLSLEAQAILIRLWLLASESKDGSFDADVDELSFRLRVEHSKVAAAMLEIVPGFAEEVAGDRAEVSAQCAPVPEVAQPDDPAGVPPPPAPPAPLPSAPAAAGGGVLAGTIWARLYAGLMDTGKFPNLSVEAVRLAGKGIEHLLEQGGDEAVADIVVAAASLPVPVVLSPIPWLVKRFSELERRGKVASAGPAMRGNADAGSAPRRESRFVL